VAAFPASEPGSLRPGGTEAALSGRVTVGKPGYSPPPLSGLLCSSAFTYCLTTWRSDGVAFLSTDSQGGLEQGGGTARS